MVDAPLALAFAAGLVSTLNPCGFAMLPAYLAYLLGNPAGGADRADGGGVAAIARGLRIGGVVSLGFLTVFGIAGIALVLGAQQAIAAIPWLAIVAGASVALLGVALVAGVDPAAWMPVARAVGGAQQRADAVVQRTERAPGLVFGGAYAIASLSCTLPIFLTVVVGSGTRGSVADGLATFAAYAAGMALLLVVITVALALGRDALVARLRSWTHVLQRGAGAVMALAGGFIVWFWADNLARGVGASSAASPVTALESLSARLTALVGENATIWGAVLTVVLGLAVAVVIARRSTTPDPPATGTGDAAADAPRSAEQEGRHHA